MLTLTGWSETGTGQQPVTEIRTRRMDNRVPGTADLFSREKPDTIRCYISKNTHTYLIPRGGGSVTPPPAEWAKWVPYFVGIETP